MSCCTFILLLLAALVCAQEDPKRIIFDEVFTTLTKKSKCVSNRALIKAYIKSLYKEILYPEEHRAQKNLIDKYLSKYQVYRKWSSLNYLEHQIPQYQICIDSDGSGKLYAPQPNNTQVGLSVKETVERYPYLKSNLHYDKITELIQLLPPYVRAIFMLKRYTIIEGILYTDNYPANESWGFYETHINPYLNKLPNMDFVMSYRNEIHARDLFDPVYKNSKTLEEYDGKVQLYKRIMVLFPIFMLNKDLSTALQFNKLLLVETQKLDEKWWNSLARQVEEGSTQYKWEDKIEKAYYRSGVSGLPYDDVDAHDNVPLYFPRLHLVNISRNNPDMVDAEFSGNQSYWQGLMKSFNFTLSKQILPDSSFKDMQKYKYLISMAGWATSKLKMALIMHSNSVLLKHQSGKVGWYYDQLKPNIHYIPLTRTLDNLLTQITYLRQNDQVAKQVVKNAQKFFNQRLTPQAVQEDLVRILKQYAEVQRFSPGPIDYLLYKSNQIGLEQRSYVKRMIYSYINSFLLVAIACIVSSVLLLKTSFGRFLERVHCKYERPVVLNRSQVVALNVPTESLHAEGELP